MIKNIKVPSTSLTLKGAAVFGAHVKNSMSKPIFKKLKEDGEKSEEKSKKTSSKKTKEPASETPVKKTASKKTESSKNKVASNGKPKKEYNTHGPNATHAISADTGKPIKLSAEHRKNLKASYAPKETSGPSVNLEEGFTPRQFGVTDKRSSAK